MKPLNNVKKHIIKIISYRDSSETINLYTSKTPRNIGYFVRVPTLVQEIEGGVKMSIEVRLFATLREGRGKKVYFEFEDGINCDKIIKKMNIKKEDVAILLINGRDGDLYIELNDNDIVSIFPPVGGG